MLPLLLTCVCRGGGEVGVAAEAPEEDVAEGVGGVDFTFVHSLVEEGGEVAAGLLGFGEGGGEGGPVGFGLDAGSVVGQEGLVQSCVFRTVAEYLDEQGIDLAAYERQVATVTNNILVYGDNNAPIQNVAGSGISGVGQDNKNQGGT